jgi:predicted AlkP superfamily pyrophosphatase or phosphodiesterase
MRLLWSWRKPIVVLVVLLACAACACASAYNARPKLVVMIVIDQFRGDYLERYRDQFGDGGFRYFSIAAPTSRTASYDYANTRTAPGHATLLTGSYTSGHGIVANEWWDPQKKKRVTSVEDDSTKLSGHGARAKSRPRSLDGAPRALLRTT